MAYDTALEQRIDAVIADWPLDVPKKKMFGGVGYFLNGNMAFGIKGDELIVKATEEQGDKLLKETGMRYFTMGARTAMKNWYLAGDEALLEGNFERLLGISRDFTLTLAPKHK